MQEKQPPLKLLHPEASLVAGKLAFFERLATETIVASLAPGLENCLKARPDGTILEGNHRIYVLRRRGVDIEQLPREIVARIEP